MPKPKTARGILLTSNLPQLQNLIKVCLRLLRSFLQDAGLQVSQRDPEGYKEEFLTQYNHYLSLLRLHSVASSTPSSSNDKSNELFADLITFISQVAQCYPEATKDLPMQLSGLLLGGESGTSNVVTGDLRKTAVKNLVMLRNKEIIDSIQYV